MPLPVNAALYETWGACIFREWKVAMNGYEYCIDHSDQLIRQRAEFHRTISAELYPLTRAMEIFAPNGMVRKRVRDERSRYTRLFGEPTVGQKFSERVVIARARKATRASA